MLLIAPCTANNLAKIAAGRSGPTITTFTTTAIGSKKPVLIVPAVHHSRYRHQAVAENTTPLYHWGITRAETRIEAENTKISDTEEIVRRCERAILPQVLK